MILITGASGFLGRHLVKFYKDRGCDVICQIRTMSAFKRYEKLFSGCDVRIGDISDHLFVRSLFNTKPKYVIHAAACKYIDACEQYPKQCLESNFFGTFNVVTSAHESGVTNLVFVSTDKARQPSGLYGYSKIMGEWMTRSYGYNVYRGVNFWGSDGSFIRKWMRAIANNETVTLNDPSHVRYFRFINDVVADIHEALLLPKIGKILEPSEVIEVPIVQVYDKLKSLYPNNKFVIGNPHRVEKQYEEISPFTKVRKSFSVETLLNNIPV